MSGGATLRLTANLSNSEIVHKRSEATGTTLWGETSDVIAPWTVFWRLEAQ
jgi:maltooligosyltrehalose trehalohydrolase